MLKNFLSAKDLSPEICNFLINRAQEVKFSKDYPKSVKDKILGLVFFNQSLRTKLSFESAMARCGGTALSITPGDATWNLETELSATMNRDKAEHIIEASKVISRYVDAIGVRCFAKLNSLKEDLNEDILNSFAEHSTVPVISLESAMEHPCQMLADMLTLKELEKPSHQLSNQLIVRWAPHKKALPLAVPHSAALAGGFLGKDITVVIPSDAYHLEESYEAKIKQLSKDTGGSFNYSYDKKLTHSDSSTIYVKSWGAPAYYGNQEKQLEDFKTHADWMVTTEDLAPNHNLMHCLPVRRNLVISDNALDSSQSKVIDQAENRLWAQLAILESIFS